MIEKQEIINYVFKDEPNPYVLDSMLTEIGGEGDSSESGKWKDATITLINSNPEDNVYFYYDSFNPETVTTVFAETIVHLPVLNTPSGKTQLSIGTFGNVSNTPPICTGNIEFTEEGFMITGDGTITLAAMTIK